MNNDTEREQLATRYAEAIGDENWAAYASEYFQEKHDRLAAMQAPEAPAASQPSEPCFNRARVMADEVMTELQATESAWDDDDIDRIQSSLLPRVYDCLNLLAAAQAPKEPT